MFIPEGHNWVNKMVREVNMPTGSLAIMIKRGKQTIVTSGDTVIHAGDNIILSVPSYEPAANEKLEELHIEKGNEWCGKTIAELNLPPNELIAMIIRGNENLIPDGKTVIEEGDVVVTYK